MTVEELKKAVREWRDEDHKNRSVLLITAMLDDGDALDIGVSAGYNAGMISEAIAEIVANHPDLIKVFRAGINLAESNAKAAANRALQIPPPRR